MAGATGEWSEENLPKSEVPEIPSMGGLFGAVWEQITGFFVAMFQSVWSGFLDMVPRAFMGSLGALEGYLSAGEDVAWEGIYALLEQLSFMDKSTISQLLKFKGLPFPYNSAFNLIILGSVLKDYVSTVSHATGAPARHELMKLTSPELPMPSEVLRAAFVAPEKTGEVREVFRKSGLSDEVIDLIFLSAYQLYDVETIKTLWLRKIIDDDYMFMRMRELGFTDTRIKEIVQTWEIIPGPQDLFWMVGKEAFEPDAIKLMGLGDEFPEEQSPWLEKQGISRFWQEKYWYAHWDQPSIQMGYDMYHRNVIGLKELDMLFKTIEIPPYWREKLIQIAFLPFTRVDVRRMHKEGVLNDAELLQAYKDLGYNDEKAAKLAEFTKRYNAKVGKDLTMSQVIEGYKDKIIQRSEAMTYLQDMEYSEDESDYLLKLEDYKEQKALLDAQIDNVKKRYVNNFIEAHEARAALDVLNLPAAKTNSLIETWTISRFEALKLPSKTDLDKFYLNGIIDEDTYVTEMFRLGYNVTYISWYAALLQSKKG